MPILTEIGLKKLTVLKNELQALLDKKHDSEKQTSSPYSKKMLANLIAIIDLFKAHNDTSITAIQKWTKVIDQILNLWEILEKQTYDSDFFTFLPYVFNEESLLLIESYHRFISSIDTTSDFGSGVWTLMTLFHVDFARYTHELTECIRIYKLIKNAKDNSLLINELKTEISHLKTRFSKESSSDLLTINDEYKKSVSAILDKTQKFTHFNLEFKDIEHYANTEEPPMINIKTLTSGSLLDDLMTDLFELEETVNTTASEPITIVLEHSKTLYQQDKYSKNRAHVLKILAELEQELKLSNQPRSSYFTAMASLFSTPPSQEKIAIMNPVLAQIQLIKESKDLDIGNACFTLYKELHTAGRKNLDYCRIHKIKIGKVEDVCYRYKSIILSLAMDSEPGSNRQAFKLPEKLASSATAMPKGFR